MKQFYVHFHIKGAVAGCKKLVTANDPTYAANSVRSEYKERGVAIVVTKTKKAKALKVG